MSAEAEERPWGTILTFLTILALANWWFEPFERDRESAAVASQERDPMVRRTQGWTPPRRATITPGVQTLTGSGQCTTNFVFTDAARNVYLGQAAHCGRLDDGTDGCRTRTRPLGTRVVFMAGATTFEPGRTLGHGRLAYSSWRSMQERGVRDPVLCAYNDFALVRVPRSHHRRVNPTLPFWGGPTGLSPYGASSGDHVYGFGRSSLRTADSTYSRQAATALQDRSEARGWSHTISSSSPGLPGDSGSGYVDEHGRAIGTLSTLTLSTLFVWNGLSDLSRELAYARRHSGIRGLRLELGTTPFRDLRAENANAGPS